MSSGRWGTTTFLLANWDLHERIVIISPHQTASALYLSMTRFVCEHAVVATHAAAPESATEWLHIRMEMHEELVNAIIAGLYDALCGLSFMLSPHAQAHA